MISGRIKDLAKENDWHECGSTAFGLYKGYLFVLETGPASKFITVLFSTPLSQETQQGIERSIAERKRLHNVSEFSVGATDVSLKIRERLTYTRKHHLYLAMDFLVELFGLHDLPQGDHCYRCNSQRDVEFYCAGGSVAVLCDQCAREAIRDWAAAEQEYLGANKHYFRGTLGAIAFALPAILLWVILAAHFQLIALFMPTLLASLAIRGYAKFRGEPGRCTPWITFLVSILGAIITNCVTVAYQIWLAGQDVLLVLQSSPRVMGYLGNQLIFWTTFGSWPLLLILIQQWQLVKFLKFRPAKRIA